MNIYPVKGAFGRQARFARGPLATLRATHPLTGDFVQMTSIEHKHCLLQYIFTPGVQSVCVDQQLPTWVANLLPRGTHALLLATLADGSQVIVRLRRPRKGVLKLAPPRQVHQFLWIIERSTDHVEEPAVLNRNLETMCQLLVSHAGERLEVEATVVIQALRHVEVTSLRDLTTYAAIRAGVRATSMQVILARLLAAQLIGINLVDELFGDDTPIAWGALGTGFHAPVPPSLLLYRVAA